MLPHTERHVFERSGHQAFIEEPEAFRRAVLAWLERTR